MAKLVVLEPAQQELEEIAQLHLNLVGPESAARIVNEILDTLGRLEQFPQSGHVPRDRFLRQSGYRLVIAQKYICVYRCISDKVVVYLIAHGARDYSSLFKAMLHDNRSDK